MVLIQATKIINLAASKTKMNQFILTCFFLFSALTIYGCECAPIPSVREAIVKSGYVALAKVRKKKWIHLPSSEKPDKKIVKHLSRRDRKIWSGTNYYEVHLDIIKIYKGEKITKKHVVYVGIDDTCGFNFEKGETYIIYAYKNRLGNNYSDIPERFKKDVFETNSCTRTKKFDQEEIQQIENLNT